MHDRANGNNLTRTQCASPRRDRPQVCLALLAVPPMNDPLSLLHLLEHQPGDGLLALLPVFRVGSDGNYAYSVRLEELIPKRLVTGKSDCHAF